MGHSLFPNNRIVGLCRYKTDKLAVYIKPNNWLYISSGVSHSDGSCVLGRIHSDVSSNIPKKVYHIVTDNFVNLLHISYAWLYKTECWGRKFHAFSFNSHRNCKIFMTNFNFIFDTTCVPYIFRKSIFGWNCDHDTPLCDTPLLEDTPLCDTPDDIKPNKGFYLNLYTYSKQWLARKKFKDFSPSNCYLFLVNARGISNWPVSQYERPRAVALASSACVDKNSKIITEFTRKDHFLHQKQAN